MLEERKKCVCLPTFLLLSSGCSFVRGFVLVGGGKMRGCCVFLFFFFPSTPSLVVSVPRSPSAKPEERLNDSGSTFGRCWEYVGLRSLSEPLDSCRESPAAPGPPEDMRPFQTEEGNSTQNIPHIFWGRKKKCAFLQIFVKKKRKCNRP